MIENKTIIIPCEPTWLELFKSTLSLAVSLVMHGFFITVGVLLALHIFGSPASGASLPRAAFHHRAALVRAARLHFGLDAPVAVFAAQIHVESRWNAAAQSRAGAQGLAQFMPATARWLPSVMPLTGESAPFNPGWSINALCAYDKWLFERIRAANSYERMAFALSAYNGGLGWVLRDKAKAAQTGRDDMRWFGSVEEVNAGRSKAAFAENRAYPRLILKEWMAAYAAAGFGAEIAPPPETSPPPGIAPPPETTP